MWQLEFSEHTLERFVLSKSNWDPLATTYSSSLAINSLPQSTLSPDNQSICARCYKILVGRLNCLVMCKRPDITSLMAFVFTYKPHLSVDPPQSVTLCHLVCPLKPRPWHQLLLHGIHRTPCLDFTTPFLMTRIPTLAPLLQHPLLIMN